MSGSMHRLTQFRQAKMYNQDQATEICNSHYSNLVSGHFGNTAGDNTSAQVRTCSYKVMECSDPCIVLHSFGNPGTCIPDQATEICNSHYNNFLPGRLGNMTGGNNSVGDNTVVAYKRSTELRLQ